MIYTNEQKKQLRADLKAAGYGCKIQEARSPFSGNKVTFLSFIPSDGKPVMVTSASVFGKEFREKHNAAFEIINKFAR